MARIRESQSHIARSHAASDRAHVFGIALRLTIGLALILRLWRVGAKSLWLDETMTVANASRPFMAMIEHLKKFDAHPPLYQAIEWLWLRLGAGDGFARFPSVVAGVVGVWLTYLISRRLFGRAASLAATLLMTVSCFNIYYSQEARLNALVTTLFLAQVYLLLRILHQRGKAGWGWWAAYGFVALVSLYTYAPCILTIGALAVVYLWLSRKGRRQFVELIVIHVMVGLLFLPWVPILRRTTARLNESVLHAQDAAGRPGPVRLANGFAAWGAGPHEFDPDALLGAGVGLALVIAGGIAVMRRRTRRPAKILGALFLLPLAAYLIMPMPRVQAYDARHLIFLQPLLLIALAGARTSVRRCSAQRGLMPLFYVMAAVIFLNILSLSHYYPASVQKENWRGLFEDVAPKLMAEDAIIFNPGYVGFAMEHYAGSADARSGIKALAQRGAPVTTDVQRIWLIECSSPVSKPWPDLSESLAKRNWTDVDHRAFPGRVGDLQWTLYTRSDSVAPEGVEP